MLVSIIIPTHNRAQLLSELLSSVLDQVHRPVEVVVIDDASTDRTQHVVECFARDVIRDTEIVVTSSLVRKGGAQVARNQGIRMAQGEALMFVDSDDILAPSGLGDLTACLEVKPYVQIAYGKVQVSGMNVTDGSTFSRKVIGAGFGDSERDLIGYHWHTMGALYRRDCINRIGLWNEELRCSQDWEYQIRAKLFGDCSYFVDALVGYWRQHGEERIGGKEFRDDYAESTEPLFRSIHENAIRAGRNTKVLQSLLTKRLVRHAIYAGANCRPRAKQQILSLALALSVKDGLSTALVRAARCTPSFFDRFTLWALNRAKPTELSKVP